MAKYRNRFHTILQDENGKRYPVQHEFDSADLNGKVPKEYMVIREVDGVTGALVGPEIKLQPEIEISGL